MPDIPSDLVLLIDGFAALPEVAAVVLAGSVGAETTDAHSDYDLYVYADGEIPVAARRALAEKLGRNRRELDNRFWEPGDEWALAASGRVVDIMYRSRAWIEERLAALLVRHEPSLGYTTCFWDNVLASRILFDRTGWFAVLQEQSRVPYPEPLAAAIIRHNLPLLRTTISSYKTQLLKAAKRGDPVSGNHRAAAFLASYFDILYAANRVTHPGEKRLLEVTRKRCHCLPAGFPEDVTALLAVVGTLYPEPPALEAAVDRLCDGLEAVLRDAGFLPI